MTVKRKMLYYVKLAFALKLEPPNSSTKVNKPNLSNQTYRLLKDYRTLNSTYKV